MELHTQLSEAQTENRILIQDSIHDLEKNIDLRLKDVERNVIIIKTDIDKFHRDHNYNYGE